MLDGVGAPAKREELAVEHATAGLAIRRRQRSPGPGAALEGKREERNSTPLVPIIGTTGSLRLQTLPPLQSVEHRAHLRSVKGISAEGMESGLRGANEISGKFN